MTTRNGHARVRGRHSTSVRSRHKTKAPGVARQIVREETYHAAGAEEGREIFDRQARKALGISGTEFLRRWDAGDYRCVADDVEGRKVRRLAMLIPFARRTRA